MPSAGLVSSTACTNRHSMNSVWIEGSTSWQWHSTWHVGRMGYSYNTWRPSPRQSLPLGHTPVYSCKHELACEVHRPRSESQGVTCGRSHRPQSRHRFAPLPHESATQSHGSQMRWITTRHDKLPWRWCGGILPELWHVGVD